MVHLVQLNTLNGKFSGKRKELNFKNCIENEENSVVKTVLKTKRIQL
jgi:hypothetical protein